MPCPNCDCPDCAASKEPRDPREPVARLRAWCLANRVPILPGDLIREADAARAMGLALKTLQNQRAGGGGLPAVRIRNRVHHRLADVAAETRDLFPNLPEPSQTYLLSSRGACNDGGRSNNGGAHGNF